MHVPHILAEATIREWHLFRLELPIVRLLFEGGNYLRAVTIRRNTVYTVRYSVV